MVCLSTKDELKLISQTQWPSCGTSIKGNKIKNGFKKKSLRQSSKKIITKTKNKSLEAKVMIRTAKTIEEMTVITMIGTMIETLTGKIITIEINIITIIQVNMILTDTEKTATINIVTTMTISLLLKKEIENKKSTILRIETKTTTDIIKVERTTKITRRVIRNTIVTMTTNIIVVKKEAVLEKEDDIIFFNLSSLKDVT